MTDDEPINDAAQDDDPSINPYEAPHYVEGEPEPIRKRNGVEIFIFGVNALFCAVFIVAFLNIIFQPKNTDRRDGAIICIVPLIVCMVLEFAAMLSRRTWPRRVLGIVELILGVLLAMMLTVKIAPVLRDSPEDYTQLSYLGIGVLIGFYFNFCGAYRFYRIRQADIVPVAAPAEERQDSQSASEST